MIQKNALRVLDILATESKDVSLKENVVSKGGLIQAGGFSSSKGVDTTRIAPKLLSWPHKCFRVSTSRHS